MKVKKDMTKEQRRSDILAYIRENGSVTRQELADKFHISLNTLCVDLKKIQSDGFLLEMPPRSGAIRYLENEENSSNQLVEPLTQTNIRQWTILQILRFSPEPLSFDEVCSQFSELTCDQYSSDTLRKDFVSLKNKGWVEMLRKKADGSRVYCYHLTQRAPFLYEKHPRDIQYFHENHLMNGLSSSWNQTFSNIHFKTTVLSDEVPAPLENIIQTHGYISSIAPDIMHRFEKLQQYNYQNHILNIPYVTNDGIENTIPFATGLIVYNHEKNQFYLLGEADGHKTILRLSNIKDMEKIEETSVNNFIYKTPEFIRIFHEMFSLSMEEPMHVVVRFQKFGNIERKIRTLMQLRHHTRPVVDFNYNESEILYEDTIRGLEDFAKYLRSFGRSALVLQPPELVERMKETPLRIMQAYERLGIINEIDEFI